MDIKNLSDSILNECKKIIVGKDDKIKLIIMAVLSDGHVILDDLPGVGKTTLVKTMSIALGCDAKRIQFVPDLLPSDIQGMKIFNQKTCDFEIKKGPVNTNILLADEINRAIPRTQSALLEAMEEKQITIDGDSFALPRPFIVLATQNPVEAESTFKLPAAQMDRFLIKITMGYPNPDEEKLMLERLGDKMDFASVKAVANAESLVQAQGEISNVKLNSLVANYIVAIVNATRNDERLAMGASPRASRALYRASKTWAAMQGRDFVTPDDVKFLAHPVLCHRLAMSGASRFAGSNASDILDEILESVPASPSASEVIDE